MNLGIFICMECAGIHRSLGVHISKVRSITLDKWERPNVQFMASAGNVKSNAYFEAAMQPNARINEFTEAKYASILSVYLL
jgi:stromal membrane-associated protein